GRAPSTCRNGPSARKPWSLSGERPRQDRFLFLAVELIFSEGTIARRPRHTEPQCRQSPSYACAQRSRVAGKALALLSGHGSVIRPSAPKAGANMRKPPHECRCRYATAPFYPTPCCEHAVAHGRRELHRSRRTLG